MIPTGTAIPPGDAGNAGPQPQTPGSPAAGRQPLSRWREPTFCEIATTHERAMQMVREAVGCRAAVITHWHGLIDERVEYQYAAISKVEALRVLQHTAKDRVPAVELYFNEVHYRGDQRIVGPLAYIGSWQPVGLIAFAIEALRMAATADAGNAS